ncbi:hypothetical protein [Phenylobacterium sp.]|uniref:hypothetical protein n=1 Tax=Phenylobacterium sp. TaxID=1871053 RepID=UPI002E36CA6E|nr:hypothetical protein [Phenylobacterium sp.]HEX4712667.1 hypothetical protein [Phenylobacterium sp.]
MDRITSSALRDVLEKVGPAIASGCVNVISVEAIREGSGDRWPRRREQVAAFIERAFTRVSQPGDIMVPLNDAEFVTVQPSVSRSAALGLSASVLTETLAFFLGAAAREDLRLFQVTSFVDGQMAVQSVEAGHAAAGEDAEPRRSGAGGGAGAGADSLGPISDDLFWAATRRKRLTSPPDIELDLEMMPEPTWNVGARVVASFLLRPAMWLTEGDKPPRTAECGELPPTLAGEVAVSGLAYAAELIGDLGVKVALHTPLPLNAITYSTSRYRLLHALRDLDTHVRRFLILEITELAGGLPHSRMTELVGMLAPYCRAVLARAPSEMVDVSAWRGCGLSGVTLDCRHLDATDRGAQFRLETFARKAAEASTACVGYGLPTSSLMLAAWAAGFTHLGGPALSNEVATPKTLVRLQPAELFAAKKTPRARGAA